MKSLLFTLGSQILRTALSNSDLRSGILNTIVGSRTKAEPAPMIEPDFDYLNQSASRYARTLIWGSVATLFLVVGFFASALTAAASFDQIGYFVPSVVFYTSFVITFVAAATLVGIVYTAKNQTFSWERFLRGATTFPVTPGVISSLEKQEVVNRELPPLPAADIVSSKEARDSIAS